MFSLTFRSPILFFLLLLLCGLIPLGMLLYSDPVRWAWLPLLITVYAGAQLAFAGSRPLAPVNLTFWIFTYVFFGVTPYFQAVTGLWPWLDTYSDERVGAAYMIVVLGLAAYSGGRSLHKLVRQGGAAVQAARLPVVSNTLLLLLCLTSLAMVPLMGGLGTVLGTRGDVAAAGADLEKTSTLIYSSLMRVPAFTALALYLASARRSRLMIVVLLATNLVTNFPLALPRFWLGAICITALLIVLQRARNSAWKWTIGLVALLLVAFPYADFTRNRTDEGYNFTVAPLGQVYSSKGDYDVLQMTVNIVRDVDRYGTSLGQNIAGAVLFFVPRTAWEAKPYGTGQTVATRAGYRFTNLSAPLWGEAYMAFGYVGVVLLLGLYGWMSSVLDRSYGTGAGSWAFLMAAFAGGFNITLLRGDLQNAIAYSLPVVVLLAGLWYVSQPRRKRWLPRIVLHRSRPF